MSAPNTPVCTCAPSARSASANDVDQRFGDGAGRRGVPRRPPTLGGVGVQRELADDEDRRADVTCRLLVVENAQLPELFGHPLAFAASSSCVTPTSASSPWPSGRDLADHLAVDRHSRRRDPLHENAHGRRCCHGQRTARTERHLGNALGAGRVRGAN